MAITLGNLEKIDIREYWGDEAKNFTPWLKKDKNLKLLSDAIGLDLSFEDIESSVGSFKCDLVANDLISNKKVIIENQLEKTDHDHLGKLATYASGLGADIVIWIAKTITDEHRQAIDWLNEITNEEIGFFALEIELWKIDESSPAPKFNVVCSPNEWAKLIKNANSTLTETKLLQLNFWNAFREYMLEQGTYFRMRKPYPQHWYDIAIGRSYFTMALSVNTREERIGVEIYIGGLNAKKAFHQLLLQKEKIEKEIGSNLDWQELPDKQDCRILLSSTGYQLKNEKQWPEMFAWLKENSEKFYKAFSGRVKKLVLR